jgi:hypothetical protein
MESDAALLVLDDALSLLFPAMHFTADETRSLRKKWNVAARVWTNANGGVRDGHGVKIASGSLWKLGLPRALAKAHLRQSVATVTRRRSDTTVRRNQLEQQRLQNEMQRLLQESQQAQQMSEDAQQLADNFSDESSDSNE